MTAAITQPGDTGADQLAAQLQRVIRDAAASDPRSLQVAIGPSEVGVACARRLAYKLLDWPTPAGSTPSGPPGGDPWPSIMGTAGHAWLAGAFTRSPELGARFLVEQRLTIAPPLLPGGSCDLYDTQTDTVIDWKIVGVTSMRNYKTNGPRRQYVVQLMLYGLGWEIAGRTPKQVALAFLPRGGYLSGMWVWTAGYNRAVAGAALKRLSDIRRLVITLDPEAHPDRWRHIPAAPDHGCAWCPWYRPGSADLATGCPGDLPPHST